MTDAPPLDAPLQHLVQRLELIEARVRRAVASRQDTDPRPDDGFRGLYISHAEVATLLESGSGPPPADAASAERLQEVERAADAAETDGADLRLRRLARGFGLDELDVEILLVALAPDLDPRFERLYGYLHDDVSRRRASIGLALELCGVPATVATARHRMSPAGPLLQGRLVLVEDSDRPFLSRSLRVPDRVSAHLLGDDTVDSSVSALVVTPAEAPGELSDLERSLGCGRRLAYVRERPGAAATPLAAAALARAGMSALSLDVERLAAEDDVLAAARLVAREARLLGGGVVAAPIEALVGRGLPAVRAFSEMPCPVVLVGSRSWDPAWSREVPLLCDVPLPDGAERAEMWRASVNGTAPPGLDPAAVTAQFRLTHDQVARAATAARLQAEAAGRPLAVTDLRAGARAQNSAGLERLARRTEPAVGFDDLVLPPDALGHLQEVVIRARHRETVLDAWRMGGSSSRGRGLTALFAGPSGTGKTMAAEVLAGELGLDLYTIDLATVVDKYIGETEKNLDRIFAESERVNGVLLFDEADALFGKRSEVSDAHDRYANVETAYLLQRMELFGGIAILSTNLRSNLDEAFARRLDAIIDFPEPEEEHRFRLWDRCLGPLVPRGEDLDLGFLARSFKLSGGNIRNITMTAAYLAADAGVPVCMTHLALATQREYRKLGRLCTDSEFGPYLEVATTWPIVPGPATPPIHQRTS